MLLRNLVLKAGGRTAYNPPPWRPMFAHRAVARARSGAARRWIGRAFALVATLCVMAGAWFYLTLPDVTSLATRNPNVTSFMALREEAYRDAGQRVPTRRQAWVPLREISPNLIDAVLMAEDTAFYQHDGVDYHELWESLKRDWREKRLSRGASTITQQLAKNLYLSPSRTPLRKVRELVIARRLERELSKRRILELYLNVVEWGRDLYGVEAAARRYFDVRARDLTPAQSALLAGMLINPIRYSPSPPAPRLKRRQRIILERMVRFGRISPQEYRVALGLAPSAPPPPPVSLVDTADDLVDDEADGLAKPPAFSPPPAPPPPESNELLGAQGLGPAPLPSAPAPPPHAPQELSGAQGLGPAPLPSVVPGPSSFH